MRTPGTDELVRIWELGIEQPAWYRGLLMLVPAFPEASMRDLSAISIGSRNRFLFALRRALFGSSLAAGTACVKCREPIEFDLRIEDVCDLENIEACHPEPSTPFNLRIADATLRIRPLTSADFSGLARDMLPARGSALLMERVVHVLEPAGPTAYTLTIEQFEAAVEALQERDANMETWLQLSCHSCGQEWSSLLDIASYLWSEIASLVQRVLDEVATIAQSFGWSEREILKMSPGRREFYLARSGDGEELR